MEGPGLDRVRMIPQTGRTRTKPDKVRLCPRSNSGQTRTHPYRGVRCPEDDVVSGGVPRPALDVGQDFRLKTYAGHYKSSFNSWGITMTSRRSPLPALTVSCGSVMSKTPIKSTLTWTTQYETFAGRDELHYAGFTPMNRSDVIDPETKSRGATPS